MLNHHIEGHGPPLLLLHGFGISFHIWNGLRPLLRDHFTLVEVELPGIGRSPLPPPTRPYLAAAVDALAATRAALNLDRVRLLSYSTGTRVAEAYLHSHAEHVERAAFLCPAYAGPAHAFGLRLADRFDARFPKAGNWILSGWRFRILLSALGFSLKPNALLPAWFDEITSQPMDVLKSTLRSLPAHGARPFILPDLPALFVWGRQDWITATPRRPTGRDVVIHATHAMPQTHAEEVVQILIPFLK